MRLNSTFSDYYDAMAAMDSGWTPVWNRKPVYGRENVVLDPWFCKQHNINHKTPLTIPELREVFREVPHFTNSVPVLVFLGTHIRLFYHCTEEAKGAAPRRMSKNYVVGSETPGGTTFVRWATLPMMLASGEELTWGNPRIWEGDEREVACAAKLLRHHNAPLLAILPYCATSFYGVLSRSPQDMWKTGQISYAVRVNPVLKPLRDLLPAHLVWDRVEQWLEAEERGESTLRDARGGATDKDIRDSHGFTGGSFKSAAPSSKKERRRKNKAAKRNRSVRSE